MLIVYQVCRVWSDPIDTDKNRCKYHATKSKGARRVSLFLWKNIRFFPARYLNFLVIARALKEIKTISEIWKQSLEVS